VLNEEERLNNISNLVNVLNRSTLKFDDLSFYYDATIVNKNHTKHSRNLWSLDVDMKAPYAYKGEIVETASRVNTKTINVPGNLQTAAIVEVTPSINIIDLTITGLGESFTIKNLTAGQKVIINGEDCTVIQNGVNKFGDFDGWEFPKLNPGANTITFSKNSCDVNIKIKYKPRWS
jgi:phage-related protein